MLDNSENDFDIRNWVVAREILDIVNFPWKKDIHALENAVRDNPQELYRVLLNGGFDFAELDRRLGFDAFPDPKLVNH